MIIKFDQTPEEYFRLSKTAFKRGEYDRALLYGEKAVRGKGSAEYKVSCAEILIAMGRYVEAANLAMEVLCHGRGMRAEIYEVLANAASGLGQFYEALHYVAKKAHYEGDDDTLDAMDEVMQELDAEEAPSLDGPQFFVVGKQKNKKPQEERTPLDMADFAMLRGRYEEAIALASKVERGTPSYVNARLLCLRAYLRIKDNDKALETAGELIGLEPKNGFVLYVLIDKFKRKEYVPLLTALDEDGKEIFYAVLAADHVGEHEVACRLVEKLVKERPYRPGVYFLAAAVALNSGDRKKSEDYLKRLFSIYHKYPQDALLKGWRKLKKCDVGTDGNAPEVIVRILENFVKGKAKSAEEFATVLLTDEDFRNAVYLLLSVGERNFNLKLISYLDELSSPQVDAFFAGALYRFDVELYLKRVIFAKLYLHKEKGSLFVAQTMVPVRISCAKPDKFESYSRCVQGAYSEMLSALIYMTDVEAEVRLQTLAGRAAGLEDAEFLSEETVCMAFLYRLLVEGVVPFNMWGTSLNDALKFFARYVFGFKRVNYARVRLLAAILSD